MNQMVHMAVDMLNAIAALRIKGARLRTTSEGVEIHQPRKPVILVTHKAAEEFSRQFEEADL